MKNNDLPRIPTARVLCLTLGISELDLDILLQSLHKYYVTIQPPYYAQERQIWSKFFNFVP